MYKLTMFSGDLSIEEEEKYFNKIANWIHKFEMDQIAILMLKVYKPLSFIIISFSRIAVIPYIMVLGHDSVVNMITIFEDEKNVEKLIKLIEGREKEINLMEKEKSKIVIEKEKVKKSWRRFLTFKR